MGLNEDRVQDENAVLRLLRQRDESPVDQRLTLRMAARQIINVLDFVRQTRQEQTTLGTTEDQLRQALTLLSEAAAFMEWLPDAKIQRRERWAREAKGLGARGI